MEFNYGLYPVISEEFCDGRDMLDVLKAVIDGGIKIVQLRQKQSTKKDLFLLAEKYREITKINNVKLIINDHLDIALAVKADGIHLGQDDLPCKIARKIAPDIIIGISTHNQDEIINAETNGATYINIGPIFSTSTKETQVNPLGLKYLKIVNINLPYSVMGGIKKDNVMQLLQYGAKNIAMVTEITMAEDITKTTKELVKIINDFTNK